MLPAGTPTIAFDAGGMRPDATTIDDLARLALAATRRGLRVQLSDVSPELQALLVFAGLAATLGVEPQR